MKESGEKYQIVYNTNLRYLVKGVNQAMSEGWKPIGAMQQTKSRLFQTMVKHHIPGIIEHIFRIIGKRWGL